MKTQHTLSFSGHDHAPLIRQLLDCALTCEMCFSSCLQEEDIAMMTRCAELDRDCSDICRLAAVLLQRDSEVSHEYLVICEQICRLCADECRKHAHDHCQKCAEACSRCAEACHDHHGVVSLK